VAPSSRVNKFPDLQWFWKISTSGILSRGVILYKSEHTADDGNPLLPEDIQPCWRWLGGGRFGICFSSRTNDSKLFVMIM